MAQIIFNIPDKYIQRIQDAFQSKFEEAPKQTIIQFVKRTVEKVEREGLKKDAVKNYSIEDDLIE